MIAKKSPHAALRLLSGYLAGRPTRRDKSMMQTEDRTNLETFEALFLSLGPDVVKLDGSRHDSELMQAKATAAGRWMRLSSSRPRLNERPLPSPHVPRNAVTRLAMSSSLTRSSHGRRRRGRCRPTRWPRRLSTSERKRRGNVPS